MLCSMGVWNLGFLRDTEKRTTVEAGVGEGHPGKSSELSPAGTLQGRNPERDVEVGSAGHACVCVCTHCSILPHPFLRLQQESVSTVHHAH